MLKKEALNKILVPGMGLIFAFGMLITGATACSDDDDGEKEEENQVGNSKDDSEQDKDDDNKSDNEEEVDEADEEEDKNPADDSDDNGNSDNSTDDEDADKPNGNDTDNTDTEKKPDVTDTDDADAGVKDSGSDPDTTDTDKPSPLPDLDTLAKCEKFDTVACGSYVKSDGDEVKMGPYGAIMEYNVGQGFGNSVNRLLDNNQMCRTFAEDYFEQDAESTDALLDLKTPDGNTINLHLYSVYRPAVWVEGEKYPIITWGNGTCAQPEGYGALLRYVASHGFVVVAANSRYVQTDNAMIHGLNFMIAANKDPESIYYQKLDTDKVGAMGHSQGSGATVTTARDSRVKVVILFNGGQSASKPFLAVSGKRDMGSPTEETYRNGMKNGASKGAFIFYNNIPETGKYDGHLTLMTQPERVVEPAAHWFRYMLNGDPESREWFVGDDCKLCNRPEDFAYGQKGLE